MLGPKRNWLAYADGTYEQVDPMGNVNRKKRGPDREDWWVVEKDQGWSPPRGRERPMNTPSKGKEGANSTAQRNTSILSGGSMGASGKPKPEGALSFMEEGWDRPDKVPDWPLPGQGMMHKTFPDMLPREGDFVEPLPPWKKGGAIFQKEPGQLGSILSGLFDQGSGIIDHLVAYPVPVSRDMIKLLDNNPERATQAVPDQDVPRRSAHAAARLTPVNANAEPEVRLLDQGLDPEVEVKGMPPAQAGRAHGDAPGQDATEGGQATADGSPLPSWLGKMPTPTSQERNPYQTAREMGQQDKAPNSPAQGDQGVEGLDQSGRTVPLRAPRRVLGTPEYYKWRAEEFKQRHPDKEPPDYLMDYGYKYAKIFRDEIRPELSEDGKKWVDQTMLGLQKRLEQAYQDGTLDEMDAGAFKDYAKGIHPEEYLRNGFRWLQPKDYGKIMGRLAQEPKDFLMAIPEMMEIAPWVITSGEARNLEGIYNDLKEWRERNPEDKQVPFHILLRSMPQVHIY